MGAGLFGAIRAEDQMRPNVPVVLRSPEWVLCGAPAGARVRMPSIDAQRPGQARPGQSQLAWFLNQPEAASFPKFNRWMFSFDALIPGLETGQSAPAGRPTPARRGQGIAGWVLGPLAVAGFSGIVKSR